MKRFFIAILCVCSVLLGLVSCQQSKVSDQHLTFDVLSIDSVCPLFSTYDKPACHIEVQLAVPATETDGELKSAVEHFITSLPADGAFEDQTDGTLASAVNAYVRTYILQYLNEGPDAIDSYGEDMEAAATWMSYEEHVDGKALYNDNGLLCYQVRISSYTGGAHGNTKTYNGVFDLNQQEALTLERIFEEHSLEELNSQLRQQLALQYGCGSVEELAEKTAFFAPTEIEATDNYFVSDSCISWLFDPYDIAPYSEGEITISLPWDKVQPLLRADAAVKRLMKN